MFQATYCFRQLTHELTDQTAIDRSDRYAACLPPHFTDILDARKQIQLKSLGKVDAISFSIAKTTPSSVSVHCFVHGSNAIRQGTLERWLQHDSISHIDWRQVVGDQTCVYSELSAIKHLLDVTSPDPERMDARILRIDYLKPSCFNRRRRPRLAGGGCSESGGPARASAGCSGRGAAASAGEAAGGGGRFFKL